MRKASTEPRAKPSLTMADVFRKDAFSRSRRKELTTQRAFKAKVRAMIAQVERHTRQIPLKIGKYGVPMTTERQTLELRDIIQTALFRRKLLRKPRAAAMLAERLKDTKDAAYFAQIAKEAAKRARKKKHRKVIAAIAARKRDIRRINREWAAKRKKLH